MCITFRYCEQGNAKELGNMMVIRLFTTLMSKAKAAKMIRGVVDVYVCMEVHLCKLYIQWTTGEKRILRFQVNSIPNLRVLEDFLVILGFGIPPDRALLREPRVSGKEGNVGGCQTGVGHLLCDGQGGQGLAGGQ